MGVQPVRPHVSCVVQHVLYLSFLLVPLSVSLHCAEPNARLTIQLGHAQKINQVAVTPDGLLSVTASADGTATIYETSTGRELRRLLGHKGPISSVAISSDGSLVATASEDHTARIWNIHTGLLKSLLQHTRDVTSVAFSANGQLLLTGARDQKARLWSVHDQRLMWEIKLKTEVHSVALSSDGQWALTGSGEGALLWDLNTRKPTFTFGATKEIVESVAFSPDSRLAIVGARDLILWDVLKGSQVRKFTKAEGSIVQAACFSDDGKLVAASVPDLHQIGFTDSQFKLKARFVNPIVVWETNTGLEVTNITVNSLVTSVAFGPSEDKLLTGDVDGTAAWRNLKDHSVATHFFRGVDTPTGVAIIHYRDLSPLLIATREGVVDKWDLDKGALELRIVTNSRPINSIASSQSGLVITGSDDRTACVLDAGKKGCRFRLTSHVGPITSVALSSNGRVAATGSEDRTARTWDTDSGREIGAPLTTIDRVTSVALSPAGDLIATGEGEEAYGMRFDVDGRLVIANSRSYPVHVWNVASRRREIERDENDDFITSVSFSQDAKELLISSEDGSVELAALDHSGMVLRLRGISGAVKSATFSSDKKLLVTAEASGLAHVWKADSGAMVRILEGHRGPLTSAIFIENDRLIVTTSLDGTAMIWNVESGKMLASLIGESDGSWSVVGSDGHFDASSLEGSTPLHWVMDDDLDHARSIATFLREYYEPRLLPRLLACNRAESEDPDACRKEFKAVRSLGSLNRVQPEVRVLGVRRGATPDEAVVEVEALDREDKSQPNGKTKTAAYDLRLFRDGQLVGQWPTPKGGMGGPEDLAAWQAASAVPTSKHSFTVKLASGDLVRPVVFTAYAFNEDRVKSETTLPASYAPPQDMPKRKAKAYVITIGVNGYQNPRRNLEFAVKDAHDMSAALDHIKGYEVVPVSLISEAPLAATSVDQATKVKIRTVLQVLGGHRENLSNLAGVSHANELTKATPDDLVILSFSGHGHTELDGSFYMLPSDSGEENEITPVSLKKFISSEELSEWLREVDAGQMTMIIDACHSAASVQAAGFKPGPMGDRGLGQLAYDKGMRVLAASQADDVALEVHDLHQGLLTYALVQEGLTPGKDGKLAADLAGDGIVTLEEWLKYGEERTPLLYEDAKAGKIKIVSKDSTVNPAFLDETKKRAQTPALFDFHKNDQVVVLQ